MTWKLTEAYLNIKNNREAGQGALEYVGILAIVAMVLGLAYTAINTADIGGKVQGLITDVFSVGGE